MVPDMPPWKATLDRTFRLHVNALAFLVLAWPHDTQAGVWCSHPDTSFREFLLHFRSNEDFRLGRTRIPLRYVEWGPESRKSTRLLPLAELKVRQKGMMPQDLAANSGNRETDACEDKPQAGRATATFMQYSCHSDLFSTKYHFIKRQGCW